MQLFNTNDSPYEIINCTNRPTPLPYYPKAQERKENRFEILYSSCLNMKKSHDLITLKKVDYWRRWMMGYVIAKSKFISWPRIAFVFGFILRIYVVHIVLKKLSAWNKLTCIEIFGRWFLHIKVFFSGHVAMLSIQVFDTKIDKLSKAGLPKLLVLLLHNQTVDKIIMEL